MAPHAIRRFRHTNRKSVVAGTNAGAGRGSEEPVLGLPCTHHRPIIELAILQWVLCFWVVLFRP